MKQFYFLFIAIVLSTLSFAQVEGASKIYAYKQRVNPGMIRADRNGNQVRRTPQYNYFIYLASKNEITPVEIWITGEAYSVIVDEISKTPVEYNPASATNKAEVLVPKTPGRVLQLTPSPKKPQKPVQKGRTLSAKNEMVVIYKGKGKLYYKAVSKLRELESVDMQ